MSEKIGESHLRRAAILYVRQSTSHQVQHNEESRRLQYAMRERIVALGWKRVDVIDEDLGRSASGAVVRVGFERLVARVSLGEVGAVGARELSRFARNSRDWQQLIEVCRYVNTLLVDQDSVYDARQGNDRLLLGLKGSLNEYELDLLRLRAHEAREEKARRGEFIAKVAVGYRKTDDGTLEKTPDRRVRRTLELAFSKSLELGSARQALLWMREHEIQVPVNRDHATVEWQKPSYLWLYHVLTNPIYAGAYAYGRTATARTLVDGRPRQRVERRPREQWRALLRDHHEAYIEWDTFERIQEMLRKNSQSRRASVPGAAKRGAALLAGLVRCRRCGQKLMVGYSGEGIIHRYSCERWRTERGDPRCISFSGVDVDERVAEAVLEVVRPAGVEAALRAATETAMGHDEVLEALRLRLKAAKYAADRARRQYDAVDPENRLVADELERRWNDSLAAVAEVEEQMRVEEERSGAASVPSAETFATLGADLTRVWHHPSTDMRLKKRLVRAVVEEIVADVDAVSAEIVLIVHWKGGVHTELRVPKRRVGARRQQQQTPPEAVEAIRGLARVCADDEIAGWLNRARLTTAKGNPWTRALVAATRHSRHIPAYAADGAEAQQWLTLESAAELVGVATITLKRAIARGVVVAEQPLTGGPWLVRRDQLQRDEVRARILKRSHPAAAGGELQSSEQLPLTFSRR